MRLQILPVVASALCFSGGQGNAEICSYPNRVVDPSVYCASIYSFEDEVSDLLGLSLLDALKSGSVQFADSPPDFGLTPKGAPMVRQTFHILVKKQSFADPINAEYATVLDGLQRALSDLREDLCAQDGFSSFMTAGGSAELGYRISPRNLGVKLNAYPEHSILITSCEAN